MEKTPSLIKYVICIIYWFLLISKCTKLRAEDSLWRVDELPQGGGRDVNLGAKSCSFIVTAYSSHSTNACWFEVLK